MLKRKENSVAKQQPTQSLLNLRFYLVTPDRWPDLVQLFGPRGACAGCWCMHWRVTRAQWSRDRRDSGARNKRGFKRMVDSGEPPGILAYANDEAVGWCSVGPRESYPSLERYPPLKKVDEEPVWSIVCFYVAKPYRGRGMMSRLLKAAVDYAKKNGAKIVEGYPDELGQKTLHGYAGYYMGLVSTFRKAGFVEVLRRSQRRPIMRYFIKER